MRKIFIFIGLFLFICIPSIAQSGITQLTDNSYDDWDPQISNSGQVVWEGCDGPDCPLRIGDLEIFLYNGTTTIQLSDNSYHDYDPQINDSGQVVWWGESGAIFLYNGTTTIQLADDWGHDPQINDSGQVVWGAGGEIFLYNGTTTVQLTDDNYADSHPQINNSGQVVWMGAPALYVHEEIYLYNGTTTIQLSDNSYRDLAPQINDSGQVVWLGYDGSDDKIFLYNGTTTIQLSDNSYSAAPPQINNSGQVVWMGHDGSDYEIFLYNGTTTIPLTDNSYDDYYPQINDSGQVVWWGGSKAIFLYNGTTTIQLSDKYYGDHPQINNSGQVVWTGRDCSDREIYLYTPTVLPTPDIKANGSDGPIYVTYSNPVSVTVQLDAAGYTDNADWWVLANTPFSPPDDWYHYTLSSDWLSGQAVTYQGPLFDLAVCEIFNMSDLPVGSYTFYFGVDTAMNGSIDTDQIYYDSVEVTIDPY